MEVTGVNVLGDQLMTARLHSSAPPTCWRQGQTIHAQSNLPTHLQCDFKSISIRTASWKMVIPIYDKHLSSEDLRAL